MAYQAVKIMSKQSLAKKDANVSPPFDPSLPLPGDSPDVEQMPPPPMPGMMGLPHMGATAAGGGDPPDMPPPPMSLMGLQGRPTALDTVKQEILIHQDLVRKDPSHDFSLMILIFVFVVCYTYFFIFDISQVHPNVAQLREVVNQSGADKFYLFMEFCTLGQLMSFDLATRRYQCHSAFTPAACQTHPMLSQSTAFATGVPQPLAKLWMRQLCSALQYGTHHDQLFDDDDLSLWIKPVICDYPSAHTNRCIHRDLKPENLLLSSTGSLKLADWGVSHRFSAHPNDRCLSDSNGTYHYCAPEMFTGLRYDAYRVRLCSKSPHLDYVD